MMAIQHAVTGNGGRTVYMRCRYTVGGGTCFESIEVNPNRLNQDRKKVAESVQYLALQLREGNLTRTGATELRDAFYRDPERPAPQASVPQQSQQPQKDGPHSLLTCFTARDSRGQRISRLNWRGDIIKLQRVWSAMLLVGISASTALYALGFVHALYGQSSALAARTALGTKADAIAGNSDNANAVIFGQSRNTLSASSKARSCWMARG